MVWLPHGGARLAALAALAALAVRDMVRCCGSGRDKARQGSSQSTGQAGGVRGNIVTI
ncbi:MAG: hypothetical protein LBT40_14240 [Deltaproteobacteria bacterium]|nr:hypothetical protein [Deltaproteobacteria bacterium]